MNIFQLPKDIIQHCVFNYLNDKDKIRFIRCNKSHNYIIKEYIDEYKLNKVPSHIRESNKLTKIYTNQLTNLPNAIIWLVFYNDIDYSLINNYINFTLPSTIQYLYLHNIKNYLYNIINKLQLISLTIGCKLFNELLINLPHTLIQLRLDYCYLFNQSLHNLPITLHTLILNKCLIFNQSLYNLPITLHTLTLEKCPSFNQSLNILPATLKHLKIIDCIEFYQNIDHLPITLKTLIITNNDYMLANSYFNVTELPALTHLELTNFNIKYRKILISPTLKYIKINDAIIT